ncbi:hypothetical protein [Thermogymnomonas acidicola]|uniref:hypothetical protein n=1 Tax=Thermogymnomonas acidicola TaxID=399579 RepID=UPI000946178A|nr:hypothetical protein [Thermogymnomonas acidicola]
MQKGVSRSGRPVSYKGDVRKFRVGQGSRYLQYGDGLPYSSLEEDKPIRGPQCRARRGGRWSADLVPDG